MLIFMIAWLLVLHETFKGKAVANDNQLRVDDEVGCLWYVVEAVGITSGSWLLINRCKLTFKKWMVVNGAAYGFEKQYLTTNTI